MRYVLILSFLAFLLLASSSIGVRADTYTVTTLDDHDDGSCDSDCTLREAINAAQLNCWDAKDLINFYPSLSGEIRLNSLLPTITCPLVIDGDSRITLDGDNSVDYALQITAWDGFGIDPDVEVKNIRVESFTYGIIASPQGQLSLDNIEISDCSYGLVIYPNSLTESKLVASSLRVHDNSRGVYIGGSGSTTIYIVGSHVYSNILQGIVIAGGDLSNVNIGDIADSSSGNFIYGNGAEGILLMGNVHDSTIAYNKIGLDNSGDPHPNAMGGITLINGPYSNYVYGNDISYNSYQNLLLGGSGTHGNLIEGNFIGCDPTLDYCYIGIWIGDSASSNVIDGNIIAGHRFEGIAVVGPSNSNIVRNNRVGSFARDGSYLGNRDLGNGAGIAIISAAAPDIHYPFPVYATGPDGPGPDSTSLEYNEIASNRGAGIILIKATNFEISGNNIYDNSLHGIYWVGSSGLAQSNNIYENDGSGVRIEPFFGSGLMATSPSTHSDDVISSATSGSGLSLNFIEGNKQYGILILDNPWASLDSLNNENLIWPNSPKDAVKIWFGHVKLHDTHGNPLSGTVEIYRNDDSSPDYTAYCDSGNCGPPGFDLNNVTKWLWIVEEELSDFVVRNYNPHRFSVSGEMLSSIYYWNGLLDPDESGGALESPPGSGAFRYQYASLTYAVPTEAPISKVMCRIWAELNASSTYPISPGKRFNYVLRINSDCDRKLNVLSKLRLPDSFIPLMNESWVRGSFELEGRELILRSFIDPYGSYVLNITGIVNKTHLGDPLRAQANISCLSSNCIVYDERSDDPLTKVRYDATMRPLSLLETYALLNEDVKTEVNLSMYGNFTISLRGCEGWLLSLDSVQLLNGSKVQRPSGYLHLRAPKESSCIVSFDIEEPSDDFKPLLNSSLAKYVSSFKLIASSYEPELSLDVNRELRVGKPFPLRVRVSNPGDLNLSAEVRIPLRAFKLLGTTFITTGDQRVVRGELVWYLKLPSRGRANAQFILIPIVEGDVWEEIVLHYEIAGKRGEIKKEIEIMVEKITEKKNSSEEQVNLSIERGGNSTKASSIEEVSKTHEEVNEPTSVPKETELYNSSPSESPQTIDQRQRASEYSSSGYSILIALAVASLLILALLRGALEHP